MQAIHADKHSETHTDGAETVGVRFDATDRCCALVPAVSYLASAVRWAVFGANDTHKHARTHSFAHSPPQLSHQLSLTHQIYVLCANRHTNTAVFQLVYVFVSVWDGDVFTIWRNVQYLVM